MAFCVANQKDVAVKFVNRVLQFNPDYLKAKQLQAHLHLDPVRCSP
jgi:hypothetical protein